MLSSAALAYADDAQRPNPIYLQARDLWQKISASQMPKDQKAVFGKRFGDLAAEQRQLWNEAGAVDRGECSDQCLDDYNAEIESWQNGLSAFNDDAQAALDSADLPQQGVWRASGKFNQVNVGCVQAWICVPAQQIMYDPSMQVVSTPAKLMTGVCQVTTDPTSCGQCTATFTPPQDICIWHLEPKP